MISAEHDRHRCRPRVGSSRHGQPLPIASAEPPNDAAISLSSPAFGIETGYKALLEAPRHHGPTGDQCIVTRARA